MTVNDRSNRKNNQYDHKVIDYLNRQLEEKKWTPADLVRKSMLSQGEISKILSGDRKGLSAKSFYFLYTAFGDSCIKATKIVYPNLTLKLNEYQPKKRNLFGEFMEQFENVENTIEELSVKTGISENRLKDLYFRKAALEAFELLLIERAIGKEPGELFEAFFGNDLIHGILPKRGH